MSILLYLFFLFLLLSAYCLGGYIVAFHRIHVLTTYGILTLCFYISQSMFAFLNRRQTLHQESLVQKKYNWEPVNLHIVGYRENLNYFRQCLQSVKDVTYSNIRKIIIVIDGNEKEDMHMDMVAHEVFLSNCISIRLDKLLSSMKEDQRTEYLKENLMGSEKFNVLCVTQPHEGKRHVLYTAFHISELLGSTYFFNTDSDTILDSEIIDHLVIKMESDPKNACVAGTLEIFNKHSFISKLSSSRYWLAFNIERSAQSYFGCVSCCSGPNGIYKTKIVSKIIEGWIHQTFCGIPSSYGDDRALSNRILALGYRVVFSHLGVAKTETPETIFRFISQQTRWCRSSWRELIFSFTYVKIHPLYMRCELTYQLLFPIFLLATLLLTIYTRTWLSLDLILLFMFLIPLIRLLLIHKAFNIKDNSVFWYILYPILFMCILIPVKIYAVFTLTEKSWMTSERSGILSQKFAPIYPVIVWWCIISIGLFYHIVNHFWL